MYKICTDSRFGSVQCDNSEHCEAATAVQRLVRAVRKHTNTSISFSWLNLKQQNKDMTIYTSQLRTECDSLYIIQLNKHRDKMQTQNYIILTKDIPMKIGEMLHKNTMF